MVPEYDLFLDSPCDLPREMWDRPGVTMFNFSYSDGNVSGIDDLFESVTPHDFYETIRNGATYRTSQPAQGQFEEAFRASAKAGRTALYLAFSSGISGAYEGAMVARDRILEEYPDADLKVMDLKIGSTPESLLMVEAIRMWESGVSAQEIYDWAEEARWNVRTVCLTEDLDTLRRGGRIPGTVSTAGTLLDIKLLMNFANDGKLGAIGFARGRKKGIRSVVDYFKKLYDPSHNPQVVIGNADCIEDAKKIEQGILEIAPNARILHVNIGPTVGCHVGAGMLSCCFWGEDRRTSKVK